MSGRALAVTCLLATLAAGCNRAGDANPTAPANPGTGDSAVSAAPQTNDTRGGGSSGAAVSAPRTGASGGDAVTGTTGRGTPEPGARSQPAQPGVGTTGGLGGSTGLGMTGNFPPGGTAPQTAPEGNANRSNSSAAGQR